MKIIKSAKNIKVKYPIKNSTGGNISIKAATNKNSSVRLQMKKELMDQILSEIKSKLKEIMTSYQFGYDDNEWEDYSGADIYLDNRGYIVITVYAEVSYKGLVKIMDALNPIVEKYDSDAYFDADTPGRCSAYIDPDNIPSNMYPYDDDIQNSEKIYSDDSIMFEGNNYEYVTNNHGYWIYRTVVDGKGVWRAMKQDSDESQFDKLSFPITYEQARGDEPIGEPNSIARLRKDLGKKLLSKSGQSVEATEDITDLPENFQHAYTLAKNDFMNDYKNAHVNVQIDPDDPYAEEGEISVYVSGFNPYGKKCARQIYINDRLDSDTIYQALENTAQDVGIRKGHYDIDSSTSVDTVESASNEVELDPEESMIDVNIDQYIIVDSEGSWDYDSDNYDWASSDGEGSDWYSDNGVRLDDPTGVVEKIDELIEPHVPIEPGTYRVQGYIELYYTVSGVYENRYDYTSDDYSSDINSDFGSAEYNKKLSKIENVKVTKI